MEIIRNSWNQTMHRHQAVTKERYDRLFQKKDASILNIKDKDFFVNNIGIVGHSVSQLCCNNGVELMSLYNLGAEKLTGFDICDEAILEAESRCKKLNYPINFVRTNIFDIPSDYNNGFDIVFISAGSIRWLQSIDLLYKVCNRLLRTGGILYISEIHPLAEIINDDRVPSKSPLEIITSFDLKEPLHDIGSLDYIGHTNDLLVERIWYIHSLGDLIGKLLENNLSISYFSESCDDIANVYSLTSSSDIHIPLSFQLKANKIGNIY
jgi:ubiquinone/menaquinone biosynthesis C-methylase UbiE